jgi:hypothetical protein
MARKLSGKDNNFLFLQRKKRRKTYTPICVIARRDDEAIPEALWSGRPRFAYNDESVS